ncbi:hypothetical protein TNCV_268821 [Trichonephila clavipes]|nr:hypothetical protein TNCV_268821 [Trichonephila clavipes]
MGCKRMLSDKGRKFRESWEEFRILGVPLKFTLEITQLSHPLSDSLGRVLGILKLALKGFCEEKGEKRILSALFTLHTVSHENRGFSPSLQMGDDEGFYDSSKPDLRVEDCRRMPTD